MTKKQKVDDLDYDDGLDFKDFEMGFEDVGNDREPQSKPIKSFAKGVKKGLSDTEQIKSVFRKNLPEEYGKTYDMLGDIAYGTRQFSDEVIKESKPLINDLASAADKFLPSNFKRIKEKLQSIQEWSKPDDQRQGGPSKEQMEESAIGIELGRIFDQQQKVDEIKDKIDKRDKALDRGLSIAQHKDILSVLIKNANANIANSNYVTSINAAWQRKSLETSYRSLFILKDLLEEQKKSNALAISNLISITKNTALPEYRKTERDEAFLQEARARFSSKAIDAAHGFFENGIKKFKDDVKGTIQDLSSLTSMLALAGDMHQMEQEFDPSTLEDTLSKGAGSMLGKFIIGKVGAKGFELVKKNPKLVNHILRGSNILKGMQDNAAGTFKEFLGRKSDEGSGLAQYFDNIFSVNKQDGSLKHYDQKNIYNPSIFTNKVAYSITDVIPGYLARILLELKSDNISRGIKTSDNSLDLLKFDYRTNKFTTSSKIIQSIKKSISAEELSKSTSYYFRDTLGRIEDKTELSDKERNLVSNALLKISTSGASLMPSNMTNIDFWLDYVPDYSLAEKMANTMLEIYGADNNADFNKTVDVNKQREALKFQDALRKLPSIKKDFTSQAQFLVDNGLLEEAVKAGLIENGRINYDLIDKNITRVSESFKGKAEKQEDIIEAYINSKNSKGDSDGSALDSLASYARKKIHKKDKDGKEIIGWDNDKPIIGYEDDDKRRPIYGRIGTSDEAKKTNIRSPKDSVLGNIMRLPMKLWNYKPGVEDSGATTNLGPMAQDLKKEFGESVAPGGKTIDLVNANGVAMKGIQEVGLQFQTLKKKFENFMGEDKEGKAPTGESSYVPPDQLSALRGIYYNTSVIMKQNSAMINISAEGLKNLAVGLGTKLGELDLSAAGDKIQQQYDKASKFVKENSAASLLGKLGDFITDKGGDALKGGIKRGKKYGGMIFGRTNSLLSNIKDTVGEISTNIKLKALETFDVYVKGEDEPRMINLKIKANRYLDFSNNMTPIKTRADIKKIETIIVEIDESGNIINTVLTKEELENTYFVNVYKNIVEKAIDGIAGFTFKKAKQVLGLAWAGAKGSFNIAKKVKNVLYNLLDQPIDIYIKDKLDTPVLLAKRMREGLYTDAHDGSVITRPSQIKGAVFDTERKEIVISNDEFREGLVDLENKPISKSPLLKTAGAVVGLAAGITKWTLKKAGQMPGILGKLAKSGSDLLKDFFGNIPGFSFGFFGQESVDILKDIRSILKYQAGLGGSPDELAKIAGGSIKQEIAKALKKPLVGLATPMLASSGLTTFTNKQASNENINAPRSANDERSTSSNGDPTILSKLVGGAASIGGGLLGKLKGRKGVLGSIGNFFSNSNEEKEESKDSKDKKESLFSKISKKLNSFRNNTDDNKTVQIGADGKEYVNGLRKGSWQERLANLKNINKEKIRDKLDVRTYATKNIFTMMAEMVGTVRKKLSSWLGSKGDPEELAKDIADGDFGGSDNKKKRNRKNKTKGAKPGNAKGGGFFRRPTSMAGTALRVGAGMYAANSAYDAYQNVQDGNYGDAALDAGKAALSGTFAAGGLGGLASAASTVGGKAFGLGKGLVSKVGLKGLGIAGLGYGAYSAYDNMQQGNYGSAALDAALTIGGAAIMLGKGGALAAALFNPVSLTVAGIATAAALTGYGLYKGYKYLTRKEFNTTEKMRFLEYGLRGADIDQMRVIYEFEEYLESISKTTKETWQLDEKKFEIKKALNIFDIDEKDQQKVNDFLNWLTYRFKPIFSKWKLLVKNVSGEDKISWLEKASDDKLFDVYKLFRLSNDAYGINSSPFKNLKIHTDSSIITNYRDAWLLSIKKSTENKKDSKTGLAIAETGKALVEARSTGLKDDAFLDQLNNKQPITPATDLQNNTNKALDTIKASNTIDVNAMSLFGNNSLSALQAVLLKSYGLKDLRLSDIIALRNLEVNVNNYIKIDSNGNATFDYDPKKILEKVGGYFGVVLNDEYSSIWISWFKNRFLPVYLNYHTCLYGITKRNDIKGNLNSAEKLKPNEALGVAKLIMGTNGIWTIKDYCFKNQAANLDPKTCDSNILFLENKAKDQKASEETFNSTPVKNTDNNNTGVFANNDKIKTTISEIPNKPTTVTNGQPVTNKPVIAPPDEGEDKKVADRTGGTTPKTISNGSVGSLVNAPGDLFTGAGALQYLNLNDGARLEGLHPSIKKLFLGMVEEYGQLTGKKVTVNQAFRTFQEQAALYKSNPSKAARPGTSLHEFGLALDVSSADLEQLEKLGLLRKYGFTRPLGSETWHIEPAGIHDPKVRARAKKDHDFATAFIEAGIGRGGGGLGSRGKGGQVRRDDGYAKQLFETTSKTLKDNQGDTSPPMLTPVKQDDNKTSTIGSMPEGEKSERSGTVPSQPSGSGTLASNIKSGAQAANDDLQKTNYELTSGVKGTVGGYASLPDSTGKGWSGNGLLIKEAAKLVGVDPGLAAAVAAKESSLNPNAVASVGTNPAQGLFQFKPGTWKDMMRKHGKKYGIPANATPLDAKANVILGLEYINTGGTPHMAYLSHMLGPTGAKNFDALKDDDIAAKTLSSAANDNPYVFYNNGDKTKPRTKSEIISYVNTSLQKQLTDFNIPLKIGNLTQPAKAANDNQINSLAEPVKVSTDTRSSTTPISQNQISQSPTQQALYKPSYNQIQPQEAPVRSLTKSAPVVENNNNDYARLTKITEDHVKIGKRTNDLLEEIRDIIKEGFNKANTAPSQNQPTPQNNRENKAPTELPPSYIQRKRMA